MSKTERVNQKPDDPFKRNRVNSSTLIRIGVIASLMLAEGSVLVINNLNNGLEEKNDALAEGLESGYLLYSCNAAGVPYRVQPGDTLNDIADDINLSIGPLGDYQKVLKLLNPMLAGSEDDINLGHRDPDLLYPYRFGPGSPGDIVYLPNSKDTTKFLKDVGQYPFPDYPENIDPALSEIVPNYEEFLHDLDRRATAVFTNEQSSEAKRDACIFQIYRQDRDLNIQNVSKVLKEYVYRFESSGLINFIIKEHMPIYIPRVNNLLKVSGAEKQLSLEMLDYVVFKDSRNTVGEGFTNDYLSPVVVVIGNYNNHNLLQTPQDIDNTIRQTIVHELIHALQPIGNYNLSEAEANFSHLGIDLITLPTQYWGTDTFKSSDAIDTRIQYLYTNLVSSGLSPRIVYQMIVKASISKSPSLIKKIINRYDMQVRINNKEDRGATAQETFDELFEDYIDIDYNINRPFTQYIDSRRYYNDFNQLLNIMQDLSSKKAKTIRPYRNNRKRSK